MVFRIRSAALPVAFFFMAYTIIYRLTVRNGDNTPQYRIGGKILFFRYIHDTGDCQFFVVHTSLILWGVGHWLADALLLFRFFPTLRAVGVWRVSGVTACDTVILF